MGPARRGCGCAAPAAAGPQSRSLVRRSGQPRGRPRRIRRCAPLRAPLERPDAALRELRARRGECSGRAGCDRPRRRAVDLPLLAASLVATGRGRSADGVRRGRGRRHGVRPRRGVPRPQRPPRRALRGPRWHRTHGLHPRRCGDAARGLRGALRAGSRRGPLLVLVRIGDRLRRVVRGAVRIDRRAGIHRPPARQGRAVGRTPGGGRRLQQARPAVAPPRHSRVRERAVPGRDRQRGVRTAADRADRPRPAGPRCR